MNFYYCLDLSRAGTWTHEKVSNWLKTSHENHQTRSTRTRRREPAPVYPCPWHTSRGLRLGGVLYHVTHSWLVGDFVTWPTLVPYWCRKIPERSEKERVKMAEISHNLNWHRSERILYLKFYKWQWNALGQEICILCDIVSIFLNPSNHKVMWNMVKNCFKADFSPSIIYNDK